MQKKGLVCFIAMLFYTLACSSSTDSSGASTDDVDTASHAQTDSDTHSNSNTGRDTSSDADNAFGALGNTFRYGINGGHHNQSWGDDVQADLESQAGCNSQRISLPERHLDTWGYEIEVSDMNAYAALGMTSQVAFLTAPIREHSTAPASVEDWELVYYLPKNLYEPVTLASGQINPDNYWAKYVYETVRVYSPWIKVWEIWNEPDYTNTWSDTLTWTDAAPTAAQLPRFNGSIYEYIRLLRVSKEAALLADKNALIATGGIGYSSFLSAILRYTDNPEDGAASDAYPLMGGAYFDVLSFHHYPIYTTGNSDDAVDGYMAHFDELNAVLAAAGKQVAGYETTESGAPRYAVGDHPGGIEYARNYLFKVMVQAQMSGIHGIDWFTLSDGALAGASDNSYSYMGLFEDTVDLVTIDEAQITPTGSTYATLKSVLGHSRYDAKATSALALPADVRGGAFVTAEGKNALVLWSRSQGESEQGASEISLLGDMVYTVYGWDYSQTNATAVYNCASGIPLALTGTPQILVAN